MIRGERNDVFRTRQSSLDMHLPWLDDQWASGCRNGAEFWRRLKAQGFRGSLRVISEWATRRRRAGGHAKRRRIPSARTIVLMTVGRHLLTKAETVTVAVLEASVPNLCEAHEIIAKFHMMIRRKLEAGLSSWIERAGAVCASFANGVVRDQVAVRAAITSLVNGQTEGQITRLKLVGVRCMAVGKLICFRQDLIVADNRSYTKTASEPKLEADLECAPRGGQFHAAVLTVCRAW